VTRTCAYIAIPNDGHQATAANQRIADALGIPDAEEDPGDEDDGDTGQAS
jgi:hypothetical protein